MHTGQSAIHGKDNTFQLCRQPAQTGGQLASKLIVSVRKLYFSFWPVEETCTQMHTHTHTHTVPSSNSPEMSARSAHSSLNAFCGSLCMDQAATTEQNSVVYKCQTPLSTHRLWVFKSMKVQVIVHGGVRFPKMSSSVQNSSKRLKINLFWRGWMMRKGEWQRAPAVSSSTWR